MCQHTDATQAAKTPIALIAMGDTPSLLTDP